MKSFRRILLPVSIGFIAGLVFAQAIPLTQSGERIAYTGLAVIVIVLGIGIDFARQRVSGEWGLYGMDFGFLGLGSALLGIVAMSLV